MNELKLRLMLREASQRLEDADLLSNASTTYKSDSAYLLRLLGLELLLKCIHELTLGEPPKRTGLGKGHSYAAIFMALPDEAQSRILQIAGERIGPSELSNNAVRVLEEWGKNFSALRYPYEKYELLSEQQYREQGERWMRAGAPLDEAVFRYYPEELFGFIHALRTFVADAASTTQPGYSDPIA